MHIEIPTKTAAQIRTHAQNFFIKAEGIDPDKGRDIVEFIRSKPTIFFIDPPFDHLIEKKQNKESFLLKEISCPCYFKNEYSDIVKSRKRKCMTEVPKKNINSKPLESEKSRAIMQEEEKKTKKVDSGLIAQNIRKDENRNAYHNRNQINEEEKARGFQPMFAGFPSQVMVNQIAMQSQSFNIHEKLCMIGGELTVMSHKLNTDLISNKEQVNTDPQLGYYWSSIYNCSLSLQHIVNDISYIHYNALPFPPQFLYRPPVHFNPTMPDPIRPHIPSYNPYPIDKSSLGENQ